MSDQDTSLAYKVAYSGDFSRGRVRMNEIPARAETRRVEPCEARHVLRMPIWMLTELRALARANAFDERRSAPGLARPPGRVRQERGSHMTCTLAASGLQTGTMPAVPSGPMR